MATDHFPNFSHNFAWCGVINHNRMISLTLQTKYDTTLLSRYPKFAYPLEISFWIRNLLTHGQTLPGRFAIGSETIDCRFGVVHRDVITGSRESRFHHYDIRISIVCVKYTWILVFSAGWCFQGRASTSRGPFYKHGLTLIQAWVSNHMPSEVWGESKYPFKNFNGATVEVWEWITNFIPHILMDVISYPWWG